MLKPEDRASRSQDCSLDQTLESIQIQHISDTEDVSVAYFKDQKVDHENALVLQIVFVLS